MKKLSLTLTLVVGLTLILGYVSHADRGLNNGQLTDSGAFELKADGSVSIDGFQFANMSEYYRSPYFQDSGRRCKPVAPPEDTIRRNLSAVQGSQADCTTSCTTIKAEYYPSGVLTVPVVFHILHDTNGNGDLPDAQIQRQVDVLNEDYRAMAGTLGANGFDTKIQFVLAGITRHANKTWHNDRRENQYKPATGWDPNLYMNVWVNKAGGYLGYAYYPQDSAGEWWDGITLNYQACGGRGEGMVPYNQGRTLVHEAGHYFGLAHTFQGGCANGYCSGDMINDTNAESGPFYGCGSNSSCGTPDPTTNYMDYSEDLCMWQFTQEQGNRAVCGLVNYRTSLYY